MKSIRPGNLDEITKHSLLHHSKEVSDYCKCYALQLKKGQGRIKDITVKILSVHQRQWNNSNKIRKGFINLRPFLITEKEVIYGFNARLMEFRLSIFKNNENQPIFYLFLLINYNSKIEKYLFWPSGMLLIWYFKNRIKELLRYSELGSGSLL